MHYPKKSILRLILLYFIIVAVAYGAVYYFVQNNNRNWKTYTSENGYFSIQTPLDWTQTFSSVPDEYKTITFDGKEGIVRVNWGKGFGGMCSNENGLEDFMIGPENFRICHVVENGQDHWYLISKELTPDVGVTIDATTKSPENKNKEVVLRILHSLRFNVNTSEATNWKTYTNTEYGFEMGYPKDWRIEISSQNMFSAQSESLEQELEIGVYSNKNFTTLNDESLLPKSPENCLVGNCFKPISLKDTNIDFHGYQGINRQIIYDNQNGKVVAMDTVFIKNGVAYEIQLSHWGTTDIKPTVDFYNQFLSTFKFTK